MTDEHRVSVFIDGNLAHEGWLLEYAADSDAETFSLSGERDQQALLAKQLAEQTRLQEERS